MELSIPLPATGLLTPLGNTTGGQIPVQPVSLVQVTLPPCSELSRYSVRPFPSTRTVPRFPTDLAETVYDDAEPELDEPEVLDAADVEECDDEPHAAATRARAAAAVSPLVRKAPRSGFASFM